jgi:hypothetical protein
MRRAGRLVRGKSPLPGAILWKWEPPVPFVPPYVLGSSIFLYGSEADARNGANWGGSGVLVGIPSKVNPSRTHLYAVSNDHIIHACPVIRLVGVDGDPLVLPITDASWDSHPDGDDVAICSLGARPDRDWWYVPEDLLLTPDNVGPEEVGPGDDCVMVGRYINRELRQFDRPALRFGNLAMLPELVRQEERSFDQESFLVDMRSHAGFSGSPVFVYYEAEGWRYLPPLAEVPDTDDRVADATARVEALEQQVAGRDTSGVMGRTWLLGIDWGHLPIWDDVFDAHKRKVGRMAVNGGMSGVVPAWKLRELLNDETKGIKMAREQAEQELAEVNEGDAVLDMAEGGEFERFDDLASALIHVPKREIDEKRKQEGS